MARGRVHVLQRREALRRREPPPGCQAAQAQSPRVAVRVVPGVLQAERDLGLGRGEGAWLKRRVGRAPHTL